MTTDETVLLIHDKATRGLPLSAEEQALLTEWYARQDEEESRALASTSMPSRLESLRQQVQVTLAQIESAAQRIQALNRENDALRRDIALLQQRLIQKAS